MNKAGFIGRLFIKYSFQGVDSFFKRREEKTPPPGGAFERYCYERKKYINNWVFKKEKVYGYRSSISRFFIDHRILKTEINELEKGKLIEGSLFWFFKGLGITFWTVWTLDE